MKIKIVETDDRRPFENMPPCYRVSLWVGSGEIELKREYFRLGFYDGEDFDKFYFNDKNCNEGNPMTQGTFLTKKVDDKEYLRQKEEELIMKFHKKCYKAKKILEKQLREQTRELVSEIKNYDNIIKHYSYLDRGDKIRKLKSRL